MEPMPAASPAVLRKSRRVERARWGNSAMLTLLGRGAGVDGWDAMNPVELYTADALRVNDGNA